jgi:peptidylprolyl isomerase
MPRQRRTQTLLAAAVAAVAIAGCGSTKTSPIPSGAGASAPTPTATTPTASTTATTTTAATTGPLAHKPTVAKGTGAPPKTLVTHDLIVGKGPAAKAGQTLNVQYVGVLFKSGKQFDASWDRGQPFSFPLGQGQVIPGWDHGLVGMHVGGRRQLVIPAALAYGAAGSPPTIPPNSALIFDIDLISAQ